MTIFWASIAILLVLAAGFIGALLAANRLVEDEAKELPDWVSRNP